MMATLTIRNVDDEIKAKLREDAAKEGVSMEEQVRRILAKKYRSKKRPSLSEHIRAKMLQLGVEGVELELPPREVDSRRPVVDFSKHLEEWENELEELKGE